MKNKQFRKNKFGNKPKTVFGIWFRSTWEADRYKQLRHKLEKGAISYLRTQYPVKLHDLAGEVICKYVADFAYFENGFFVIEDAKGVLTKEFRQKFKWMESEHKIKIRLTFADDPATW